MQNKGVFITFEGDDGVGKSTHIRFLEKLLVENGNDVLRVREPGGTPLGEKVREILLDPANESMSLESELLLYEAARAQIVRDVIKPALEEGKVVLCDRFIDSTVAYQGGGRGLNIDFVNTANQFATGGLVPDRTILMVLPNRLQKLGRLEEREGKDRLESANGNFFEGVNAEFSRIAEEEPDRVRIVEAGGLHSETALAIIAALQGLPLALDAESPQVQASLREFDAQHAHSDANFGASNRE